MGVLGVLARPPANVAHRFRKPFESMALGCLGSALRSSGHEAVLLDAQLSRWSPDELAQEIFDCAPAFVGLTTVSREFQPETREVVEALRGLGFTGPILLGGHAVSFFPARILRGCLGLDAVITGEGDSTITVLATALANGEDWRAAPGVAFLDGERFVQTPAQRIYDLDMLSMPARDLTDAVIDREGNVSFSTSRGCYARCTFCSIPRFYGLWKGHQGASDGWLARSPELVVQELEMLSDQYHVREIVCVDDEFFGGTTAGHDRALKLGALLRRRQLPIRFAISCRAASVSKASLQALRDGGLSQVCVGLEAGDAQALALYAKGHSVDQNRQAVETIRELGLSFQPGFIMFNHASTLEELQRNVRFLKEISEFKPTTIDTEIDPHFGAPISRLMDREGYLVDDGGVALRSGGYKHPRVGLLKMVATRCATAFQPFAKLILLSQSSITYEWRRRVPGRLPETQSTLDSLERRLNATFAGVFEQYLSEVEALEKDPDPAAVFSEVDSELARVSQQAEALASRTFARLEADGNPVKYWSQRDMIHHEHAK